LIIPEINTAFTTVNKYHSTDVCTVRKVDFTQMLDESTISAFKNELEFNQLEFYTLLDRAVYTIRKAKLLHDEMETYYIPYMDFDAVQCCWEATMARIMDYAAYNEKKI